MCGTLAGTLDHAALAYIAADAQGQRMRFKTHGAGAGVTPGLVVTALLLLAGLLAALLVSFTPHGARLAQVGR